MNRMSRQPRLSRLAGLTPAAGRAAAARTPFVLLIVVLLAVGMLALLLLNAAVNEGSFQLSELERQTEEHRDELQKLQAEIDAHSAPDALQRRARELGLQPGGNPVFLEPDGTVRGSPSPAPSGSEQPAQDGREAR